MKHDLNPHLPDATFDADETVPAGGCEGSVSRLVLNGRVIIEIACDKNESVALDQQETTGGVRRITASEVIITAPVIRLVGDVTVQGDVTATGILRASQIIEG